RRDSNSGPLVPQTSALTRLRHAPRRGTPYQRPHAASHPRPRARRALIANESLTPHTQPTRTVSRVVRFTGLGLVLALALAAAGFASTRSVVPSPVKAQIKKQKPALAYAPARMAVGFRYDRWHRTTQTVQL